MRRPGSGVSQSPEFRHCLDYSLLVGYNVVSLLWCKKTPIPARTRRPALRRVFFVSPSGAVTTPLQHAFCTMHCHTDPIRNTA
jgi:hypothetical protein